MWLHTSYIRPSDCWRRRGISESSLFFFPFLLEGLALALALVFGVLHPISDNSVNDSYIVTDSVSFRSNAARIRVVCIS